MVFADRMAAADALIPPLEAFKNRNPLVLAIPRGAVPMAAAIAAALHGELNIVLVRKLGAPQQPELALGAVDEQGRVLLNEFVESIRVDPGYVQEQAREELAVIRARRARYTPGGQPPDPAGRIVIVVDDGIATGATLLAALRSIREQQPARLIAAIGVAPTATLARVRKAADEVVCGFHTPNFRAVGEFFQDFSQISDEEVIHTLRTTGRK